MRGESGLRGVTPNRGPIVDYDLGVGDGGLERRDRRDERVRAERWELLERIDRSLEPAFVVLSGIWIALVVVELAMGGLPRSLEVLVWVIWGLFVLEFAVGLVIAPERLRYVRERWLTVLSLVLPAFRILRVASA